MKISTILAKIKKRDEAANYDYKYEKKYGILRRKGRKWDSEQERILYSILRQIYTGRKIFNHVRFEEAPTLEYDFFIPDESLVIEYNGQEHYCVVEGMTVYDFYGRVYRDRCKLNNACKRGYTYIPIPFDIGLTVGIVKKWIDSGWDKEKVIQHYLEYYEKNKFG